MYRITEASHNLNMRTEKLKKHSSDTQACLPNEMWIGKKFDSPYSLIMHDVPDGLLTQPLILIVDHLLHKDTNGPKSNFFPILVSTKHFNTS